MQLLVKKCRQMSFALLLDIGKSRTFSTNLQKSNWREDVVYLYQFPRAPIAPNISPSCLKVETFLIANDINFEVIGNWSARQAPQRRFPFIELNGKQISDTQVILWRLADHFNIDDGMDEEQRAKARAIEKLIEGSLYYALLRFVSYENASKLVSQEVSGLPIPGLLVRFVAKRMAKEAEKRLDVEGTLRHPREITLELLSRDLHALAVLLGDKKFFMGVRPTTPDFCAFGHLGVAYHLPFEHPAKKMLETDEQLGPLKLLIERMRMDYWPNWPKA
uniref:GST N-terminal domain-containing protein n=1 Tax=Globodera pallida TaxID=36090 RepID=A0A183CLN9_GLOPA